MGKKSGSGSGFLYPYEQPGSYSESLKPFFGLKYLNSLMSIRDPIEKIGSGINIPDPQQ
jgi:hypothetical protein